jgi:hypothetical protein
MKYVVEYHVDAEDGKTHRKWLPSVDYKPILDELLGLMRGGRRKTFIFGPPFILTLCAYLEATINDWLITDQFEKHGPQNYRKLTEGYLRAPLEEKLQIVVAVVTDNAFQLREESPVVQNIIRLIKARNRLTHPKALFYVKESRFKTKPRHQRFEDHPLHSLMLKDCRTFYHAVRAFEKKFFDQVDRGYVRENSLIKEIERIFHQAT